MRIVIITCLIIHSLLKTKAHQIERLETIECKPNEFYYTSRETCKSCSDLRILFYGSQYEEWSNKDSTNLGSNPSIIGDDVKNQVPAKPGTEKESSRSNLEGREILSRLIGVDEVQGFGNRYSMNQESSVGSTSIDDYNDDEQSSGTNSEVTNPFTSHETVAVEKFVDGFIASQLVRVELLNAIDQCKYNQNSSSCQFWSNLCVLSLYSHSSSTAGLTRTRSGNLIRGKSVDRSIKREEEPSSSSIESNEQWWKQCEHEFNRYTICDSLRSWWRQGGTSINREMTNIFSSSEEEGSSIKIGGSNPSMKFNQPIQLLAYKYSFQGRFIGVDQFGSEFMERFCLLAKADSERLNRPDSNFIKMGRNMKAECKFNNIQAQLSANTANQSIFVDLYLAHQSSGAVFLKPVPVLIKNMLYNGALINKHKYMDPSRFKLVHRFFLNSVVELNVGQRVLLYPKTVELDLKFKAHEKGAQLLSMVLNIDYGQVFMMDDLKLNQNNSSTAKPTDIKIEISIAQTLVDMIRHKMDFELTLTILSIISCIWSLLKSYNILRYHGLVKMDVYSLIRFLFVSCDTLANLITCCTLMFIAFLFFTFKFQQMTIHVLAPGEELDESILMNIKLCLLFKMIGLSCKIYDLLNADVFFVDWEKPKMLTSVEIQNHLSYYSKNEAASSQDPASLKNNLDPRLMGDQHKELSFWRPYAVVDRWLQMQTMRRSSLALQLIIFTCLNEFIKFTELAKTEPEFNLWPHQGSKSVITEPQLIASVSSSYRLLVLATMYLLIAVAQIMWQKYVYETMIRDKVHEFIDLCSIGNVSLFCMLYPRFGYYVHGRNANGSGDCSISEMNGLLDREERGLCSRRGLMANTDEQVFVLILPKLINDHYRKLLFQYQHQQHLSSMFNSTGKDLGVNDRHEDPRGELLDGNFFRSALNFSGLGAQMTFLSSTQAVIDSIVTRKRVINVFLANFLEHHYKDIDYSIKEPRTFNTFLSEPELENEIMNNRNTTLTARGFPSVIIGSPETSTKHTPAIFYKDTSNSFTSVLWMGLEWDLILTELLCLLLTDYFLKQSLYISCIILYSFKWLFKMFYQKMARKNLTFKALIDDKFLLRT